MHDYFLRFWRENSTGKVCKLKKSLYGLEQSPRAWIDRFTKDIKIHGYNQAQYDHTLFLKWSVKGKVTILIVNIDDIIIIGDDVLEMEKLKEVLTKEFEIKDLGQLKYLFEGDSKNHKRTSKSQRKYILDLLIKMGVWFDPCVFENTSRHNKLIYSLDFKKN